MSQKNYINIAAAFLNKYCESTQKEQIDVFDIFEDINTTNNESVETLTFNTQFNDLKNIILSDYIPETEYKNIDDKDQTIKYLIEKIISISLKEGYIISNSSMNILAINEELVQEMLEELMETIIVDSEILIDINELLFKYINLEDSYLNVLNIEDLSNAQKQFQELETIKKRKLIEQNDMLEKIEIYTRNQKNG